MGLIGGCDPCKTAVLNPHDVMQPKEGFPRHVVSCWSAAIVEKFSRLHGAPVVGATETVNGPLPVYGIPCKGGMVGLYASPVGGPAAAAIMEEVIAMGGRKFVFFGSCGVLDSAIVEGHIIVPTAAIRDEGTSYHYLPAAEEIVLDAAGVQAMTKALERLGVPYHTSKTWTTDGIYRETRDKVAARRAQGCAVVEMECASLAAVAEFRGVEFAQFVYAEDNLDAPRWEARNMGDKGLPLSDRYMEVAMECVLALPGR